ncbi:hypothetical protein E4T48_02061 [Aureobasidium sp. EXF-10727]|nr:hypothetical protein E4T48_02061 [Aureobasidium sp. EXF-10727]
MAPRRWLWPCSDSHVLRLPAYQKPTLQACLIHPEDPDQVLVDDSDDDLDDAFHSAKRRRIEAIAHAFLNGQPIYIPSARLKGPFPADRDLSLCHDLVSSPDARPVSPPPTVTAKSFIRRRTEHLRPKSVTPEPALTPSKSRPSSPAVLENPVSRPQSSHQPAHPATNKSLRFNLPSSAVSATSTTVLPPLPKFIAINKPPSQSRRTPNQLPSSTAPSRSLSSPRVRIPDTDFISPSPSPSKNDISPSKAVALRQRPASSLNRIEKAPSSSHKLSSVKKNKRPTKRVYQAATTFDTTSPFIYRKNAAQPRKTSDQSREKSVVPEAVPVEPEQARIELSTTSRHSRTPVSPEKRNHVLFQSSPDVPNPKPSHALSTAIEPEQSLEHPRHDFVPAINMSFGQESLGMDFDILNHYNGSLPAPSAKTTGTDDNVRDQQLPASTAVPNLDTEVNQSDTSKAQVQETEVREALSKNLHEAEDLASPPTGENGPIVGPAENISSRVTGDFMDQPVEDTVIEDVAELEGDFGDELPYVSTQAAMQDAHRALFDASSPLQPEEERVELPFETPAKQVTSPPSSPVHTITPFHQFNAELTTETQAPLPNTQALFDGFYSPIKLSAKRPRITKRASFAPSVILEDVDDTITSIFDFPEDGVVHENSLNREHEQNELPSNDQGQSPSQDLPSPIEHQDQTHPPLSRDPARSPSLHREPAEVPSPTDPANRSESPDFIPSQKPPASTRESTGHVLPTLPQDSVSLSEVLSFVSQRRGIDVDTLLSQATPTSSSRSVNKKVHTSARSSAAKKRSSRAKPRSSQSRRPRSSLSSSVPEQRVGQRRSTRLSLSQPIPQTDGVYDDDFDNETDVDGPPATQPCPTFVGTGRSFASISFGVPDGSSTIPDPSLAFNHAQQNATPVLEKLATTPCSEPQSTEPMSSFQHAQKQYSSLTDLDSTMPDMPQTFLPPVR